jgi:DNA repair protein RadC
VILATAHDAERLFGPRFAESSRERLAVAYLQDGQRLAEFILVAGSPETVELPLRRIFADALRLDALGLILAHNHPSGDPQPSREDIEATRILAATADRLGIRLVDHLIFAGARIGSMRGLGLL